MQKTKPITRSICLIFKYFFLICLLFTTDARAEQYELFCLDESRIPLKLTAGISEERPILINPIIEQSAFGIVVRAKRVLKTWKTDFIYKQFGNFLIPQVRSVNRFPNSMPCSERIKKVEFTEEHVFSCNLHSYLRKIPSAEEYVVGQESGCDIAYPKKGTIQD